MHLRLLLAAASVCGVTAQAADQVTFLRDVEPILNKVGCTSGPCHGAAKGKNGFKLSLRGYDPAVRLRGAAVRSSGPPLQPRRSGRSLMLAKPTQEVAHGGGLRFEPGSDYYKTIYNWICAGRAVRRSGERQRSTRLEVAAERNLHARSRARLEADESHRALPRRRRSRRDQRSRLSTATSPISPTWMPMPVVKGARIGEATLLVRYRREIRDGAGDGAESRSRALRGSRCRRTTISTS